MFCPVEVVYILKLVVSQEFLEIDEQERSIDEFLPSPSTGKHFGFRKIKNISNCPKLYLILFQLIIGM